MPYMKNENSNFCGILKNQQVSLIFFIQNVIFKKYTCCCLFLFRNLQRDDDGRKLIEGGLLKPLPFGPNISQIQSLYQEIILP